MSPHPSPNLSPLGTYTRREILRRGALAAAAGVASRPLRVLAQTAAAAAAPELIVINARVFTVDATLPRAEAFAVAQGKFAAVGRTAEVRNLAGRATRIIDAQGMTVVPGFIDCHCHPHNAGVNDLYNVNADRRTIGALQAALRERLANREPDLWLEAFMFDDTKLSDGPLTCAHLDAVSTRHPIAVHHRGGHTSWYNSRAFALAGITRETPDPKGSRYFRLANGELSGRVAGQLARAPFQRAGRRETFSPEQRRERSRLGMQHMSKLLAKSGLTSVHDAMASDEIIQSYHDARAQGELRHRAYLNVNPQAFARLKQEGTKTGAGDEWIRIGGVKRQADGSASERTMSMSTPYVGTSDHGILYMTQQEIHDAVEDAHRHDWQMAIHANGDVAIEMVLNAYERALRQWPHPDRRHRIEHCTLVNPGLLRRIKATGTIPAPFWTYVYYHGEKWEEYGEEKTRWMFAHRSFLDAGIAVVGASDFGPGPYEPMMALQSMVTRTDYRGKVWGANQRVTVDQALRIGTLNGARASYEENAKGSITRGKLADFVILEKDPHDVAPETIKDIRIARTVVGGRTTFEG